MNNNSNINTDNNKGSKPFVRKLLMILPILVIVILIIYFFKGLGRNTSYVPPVFVDKPFPQDIDLTKIRGSGESVYEYIQNNKVTLINIFGYWCVSCLAEHPTMNYISSEYKIPIIGISFNDKPIVNTNQYDEYIEKTQNWLNNNGNPYDVVFDASSDAVVALGITGAPETIIVNQEGIIKFRFPFPLSPDSWKNKILPVIEKIKNGDKPEPKKTNEGKK